MCETSALPLSYSPVCVRSGTRSRTSAPLRPSPNAFGRSTQQAGTTLSAMVASSVSFRPEPNDVFYATRLPFDPGSPIAGRACSRRSTSYVEELWSPIRIRGLEKSKLKQTLFHERSFQRTLSGFLSQAGPRFRTRFSSSWASPLDPVAVESPRATKKGDLVVALVWLAMRLEN